jgi:predicted peptidase
MIRRCLWIAAICLASCASAGDVEQMAALAEEAYVTGLSMGGFGTWDVIQRHPERFAAAVPICGGGDPAHAGKIAQILIWAYHGDKDAVVNVERSRDMIAAIKDAGGTPRYTELPGVEHDSWTAAYTNPDLYTWMFAQTRLD